MRFSAERNLPFADRSVAGQALGERLKQLHLVDPVVLALPRGGVPIGVEVARALGAPLDLLLVRKIGVPLNRELAVAAVMDGGQPVVVVDESVRDGCGVERSYIEHQAQIELAEIERRRRLYLGGRAPVAICLLYTSDAADE